MRIGKGSDDFFIDSTDAPSQDKNGLFKLLNVLKTVIKLPALFASLMIIIGKQVEAVLLASLRSLAGGLKLLGTGISSRMKPVFVGFTTNVRLLLLALLLPLISLLRTARTIRDRAELIRRTDGKRAAAKDSARMVLISIWNSRKCLVTAFNYAAPIVSIAFLVGLVSYAADLQYAVSIEYNGQQLGYVSVESAVDEAELEVQKRIAYVDGNETVTFTPKFAIEVIEDSSLFIGTSELADKMIINSAANLTSAYGFYLDGEFFGAVTDTAPIEAELAAILAEYSANGYSDVSFVKFPSYTAGLYLADSVIEPSAIIALLRSVDTVYDSYTIAEGDDAYSIAASVGVDYNDLLAANPVLSETCVAGIKLSIPQKQSFMPVSYTAQQSFEAPIAYATVNVDDNTMYQGDSEIRVAGVNGILRTTETVTYVDGSEVSRETLNSAVVAEPVNEEIAIGTKIEEYPTSVYNGEVPPDGSGNFIRPVVGGYISCYFGGHKGIDIAGVPYGQGIYAADAGTVTTSGWHDSYGFYIIIDHGNGFVTLYAHCSELFVEAGERVEQGQHIAGVGNSGYVVGRTGIHLHFEVRYNNAYTNPLYYVSQY